jgi:hypothetical protein
MSGPYSGPFGSSSSSSSQDAQGFVAFLTALTETAASAAGAAAAAIAAAQEADQSSGRGVGQEVGGSAGLRLQVPSPGMIAFYRSYEQYVEAAALPSWWLKVRLVTTKDSQVEECAEKEADNIAVRTHRSDCMSCLNSRSARLPLPATALLLFLCVLACLAPTGMGHRSIFLLRRHSLAHQGLAPGYGETAVLAELQPEQQQLWRQPGGDGQEQQPAPAAVQPFQQQQQQQEQPQRHSSYAAAAAARLC